MDTLKKIGILGVVLVLGLVAVAPHLGYPPEARADVDSWSQHTETTVSITQALTAFTPALICTAVSTANPKIKSVIVTSTASGQLIFHNANSNGGASQIGAVGVLANTPVLLNESQLRQGWVAGLGNPIYFDGPTGTVSLTYVFRP